jgi:uncharacterized protein
VSVVADTGALYALVDRSDRWHHPVAEWWAAHGDRVLVPAVVIPEVCHLLGTRIGPAAEEAFVRSLSDREFTLEALEEEDMPRAADLMRRYADLPLGFVDAAVAAAAERLETRELLTTDRRHFGVVRPRHSRAFVLLP